MNDTVKNRYAAILNTARISAILTPSLLKAHTSPRRGGVEGG